MAPLRQLLASILLLVRISSVHSAVHLPTFIASNMVLQRAPQRARIWGNATNPAEKVSVSIGGIQAGAATTQQDGSWRIDLEPQAPVSSTELTIASSAGSVIRLTNVAFGDVFLCAGQSNMQFSVHAAFNSSAEIAASASFPDLRLATVSRTEANSTQTDVGHEGNAAWLVSSPSAFSTGAFAYPSATCYFFGRSLMLRQPGVPIGLVGSDWTGQHVEAFSSPDALDDKTCGGTQPGVGSSRSSQQKPWPTSLWYGMISPLLPMRFRAAVWYQGEANANDADSYCCRFPAMIADWRQKFDLELPFFFVQLAPPNNRTTGTTGWGPYHFPHDSYAPIREAQLCALKLPSVDYAVAVDLGDPASPQGAIHPRRKQEVGRRLALVAHAMLHEDAVATSDAVVRGPVLSSVTRDSGALRVSYATGTAKTLHSHGASACNEVNSGLCCDESPFEIEVSDVWVRANFTIIGNTVDVHHSASAIPRALRYNWESMPQCAIYSGEGAPGTGMNGTGLGDGVPGTPFAVNLTASTNLSLPAAFYV